LPKRPRLPQALISLRHRNYRLLWFGNLVSISGDWMDQVAFSWLVYSMTHSTVALAMVNVCRAGPILFFTLIGGVVADRFERRRLMFTTQSISMMLAFLLAGLLSAGLLEVWMAFAIAVARGVTNSFNQPARQSLISELVPSEDLPNAVGLNSATLNLTRVIGPAIGGIMIATIGVQGAFYLNGLSFIAVLASLAMMRFPVQKVRAAKGTMFGELAAGLRYLRRETALRTLVVLALLPMVLGQPYQTMLTVFAKDVFRSGGLGLGVMQSTAAIGALCGAMMVASSRNTRRFNQQMLMGLAGFGGFLVLFAISPTMLIAVPALVIAGFCNQTYQTSNNTLVQMNVDEEYRGRVLSTLFLQRGMVPLGTVIAGVATTAIGPRLTVGLMAGSLVLMAALAAPYVLTTLSRLSLTRAPELEIVDGRQAAVAR
jgi:MFS family permease